MARPTRAGPGQSRPTQRPGSSPEPQQSPPQPTFPSDRDEPRSGQRRAGKRAAPRKGARRPGEDQPGPTSDPWERYFRPPDSRQRAAYPPPTVSPPRPGVPQNHKEPFRYPEPLPRRRAPGGGRPPDGEDDRTLALEIPWVPEGPGTGSQPRVGTQPNLARSSAVMAVGTFASRGTGFLRTFMLLYAIGTGGLADAYNNSNALPQTVYYLFLGGVFTSVMVPLMVKAARNHPDRGEAYAERIFTLGVVALLTVTVTGTSRSGWSRCSP